MRTACRRPSEEGIEVEGRVKTALPNTTFRVALDAGGEVIAHIAGKMREHYIKIIPADRVKVSTMASAASCRPSAWAP